MQNDKLFRHQGRRLYALTPLATLCLLACSTAYADGLYFSPDMLSGGESSVADLSLLSQAGAQLPGVYDVDIYLNNDRVSSKKVRFVSASHGNTDTTSAGTAPQDETATAHDRTGLVPCLTVNDLLELGVNTALYPALSSLPGEAPVSLGNNIPQAYTAFNFPKMRLDISIPQAALKHRPRGWISPERWDDGINALMVGYRFNGNESHGRYGDNRNNYLNLNSQLNIGAWRLRDNRSLSTYSNEYNSSRHWEHLSTYAERAIVPWKSRLTLGDGHTDSDVFDAVDFRGMKLASDESMYPDTMHGYAPVIRGMAGSNARVTIRQNGNLMYQTYVPAGAFVINDLYAVSAGGDLDVTVAEADGTSHTFTVPYSSVPVMQREGNVRYSVAGGRFRSSSNQYDDPSFVTSNLLWGLPGNVTTYGGLQYADHYRAMALGLGLNMGEWGAISADATHAYSQLADDSRHQGQSYRFLYARSLNELGTTLQLTGYRYSTRGFHTLSETAMKGMEGWLTDSVEVDAEGRPIKRDYTDYYNLYNTRRARLQANVSQRLGSLGSVYLTASKQTYWNRGGSSDSMTAGFSSTLGPVSYNLSYSYNRDTDRGADETAYLGISVPLSALLPQSSALSASWLNYSSSRNGNGDITHQAGMSGNLLKEHNLNWNVSQGYTQQEGYSGNASLDYRGGYGSALLGYSYSDSSYRQVSYGLDGGIYLHRDGLTLGQTPGETNILIAAPGAADVPVENGTGIHTDWRGYAVVSLGAPYRENRVSLDVNGLDSHTELEGTMKRVVPTRGALVRAEFKAHKGERVLMTLTHDGKPLPFGAMVATDNDTGIVSDDGQVYLTGLRQKGHVTARWGEGAGQHCDLNYSLPKQEANVPLLRDTEVCN
ncbi:fimbria/pilus outer membrane usher protein [Cedecea sp.]|jgi:outer membrane usher protein|uniref:fimbria/pilus outer membrane usher protein n=1 Tax=Cedecea sp. TaxID=1970739 RepID=UPI002F3FB4D5